MKNRAFWVGALVAGAGTLASLAGSPDVLAAQEVPTRLESPTPMPDPGERSPLVAALLQAALPPLPLGYIYVGDLGRALLPTGLMVAGSTLFVLEVAELVDWTDEDKSPGLLYLGLGSLVVGYVYGIIDAADAAKDHNAAERASRSALGIAPSPQGTGLQVSLSLRSP